MQALQFVGCDLPILFDLCVPREDVQRGSIAEADFAADLAQVPRGEAPQDYRDPARFFANTHPTHGLKWSLPMMIHTKRPWIYPVGA